MNPSSVRSILGVAAMLATAGFAAPIDTWEPIASASAVPTAVAQSNIVSGQAWVGYSNGSLYVTSAGTSSQPSWVRLDSASDGHGGIVNVAPNMVISSIAPLITLDGYSAYVTFMASAMGGKLWRVDYNRGGLTWTDLSSLVPIGDVLNVSVGTRTSIIYVASSTGVAFSGDHGATFHIGQANNDPLTPTSKATVSATADHASLDLTVVGTTNGEVWQAVGAKYTSNPTWTKIGSGAWGSLPQAQVTHVAIDSRDLSGKTFSVTFSGYRNMSWITRNGGQSWTVAEDALIQGGTKTAVGNISFSIVPATTTMYSNVVGFHGWTLGLRSDDNGTTWFTTSRSSGMNLALEYKHYDQNPVGNQLMPVFRIKNLGSTPVSLAGKTIQYWFSSEGASSLNYWCDWSPYGCADVHATFSPSKFDLSLPSNAVVAPDAVSGEIQGRIAKSDWSNFDQTNDYSYIASATDWTLNRRAFILVNGSVVWGSYGF